MPDNDNYLDTIRSLTGISCVAGQKTSRVINRICCRFGLDQYTVEKPDVPGPVVHPYRLDPDAEHHQLHDSGLKKYIAA